MLRDVTARAPDHGPAWDKLAVLLRLAGKDEEASASSARAAGLSGRWPPARDDRSSAEIDAAEQALREHLDTLAEPAEQLLSLQDHLRRRHTDVAALHLLALVERDRGNLFAARDLFQRALDLMPAYQRARQDLVMVLRVLSQDARALEHIAHLLRQSPEDVEYRVMYADALYALGDVESAIPILEQLIRENPTYAMLRCICGTMLQFAGRPEESARQFRAALEIRPGISAAYFGLAELRGDFLSADDVEAIREHLRDTGLDDRNRRLFQFALARVLEQKQDFAGSFAAYQAGASLARDSAYDPADDVRAVRRRCATFNARTLGRSATPQAHPPTPIFIVGMPRAGSTLLEQILASHSLVEGANELPVIGVIARDLAHSRPLFGPDAYPECVTSLTGEQLTELGARYINDAAAYRRTNKPYFVDKRPWNWLESGFIRMILPQAKIIDVRREPMAACFAMYKQNLPEDSFANDFKDLAQYYTEYVTMMAHYVRLMPGRIHFVSYERLVNDPENEIRRLLDYCGLNFEEGCLRFWETARSVATPSAEQVRRPIFRSALEQWRNFEPWLGPLKEALKAAQSTVAAPEPEGYDLALTFAAMSAYEPAIKELRAVTRRAPTHPGAWSKLAELLRVAGKDKAAEEAAAAALRYKDQAAKWWPSRDFRLPVQLEAAKRALETSLAGKNRKQQMAALRKHLVENPTDAAATQLLSEVAWLEGDKFTSTALLERTLELSPSYHAARHDLVTKLLDEREFVRALEQVAILVRDAAENPVYRALHAEVLETFGKISDAVTVMEELTRQFPQHPRLWLKYGFLLRSAGRGDESARAFRRCLEISPTDGEGYAALADLKGDNLTEADVNTIRTHLADPSLEPSSRMRMYYALGQTLERFGDFAASFSAYQSGARLIRGSFLAQGEAYDEAAFVERVRRLKRFFTARILSRSPASLPSRAAVTPIFVVGMPRAGSTLVEQILASHSQVEGTRELSLIGEIVHELVTSRRMTKPDAYPECLRDMTTAQLAALGNSYLERARAFRKTDRPYFVDKRPWNWVDAGLIHLILPQAKIIDVRREPMAACFAMFKQMLPRDCAFSYDLRDLGRYYNVYAGLMDHWQSVLPGRIHFVQYERLVEDTETEIGRMLDYCGLPFEESCRRFWETDRAVLTPSAEQVRRPIYRDAVEQWRNFEPWLGPLKAALSEPAPN
ncbi:MAG TPA: sulfotransferase [Rhizomicrobium sp.]|nr:sulfotransferase [Rhizomicrobium sp.]